MWWIAEWVLRNSKDGMFRLMRVLLWDLYRKGLWRGRNDADICAELSNFPAVHWHNNPGPCAERIEHEFENFVVMVGTALLVVLILISVRQCCACVTSVATAAVTPRLQARRTDTPTPMRRLQRRVNRMLDYMSPNWRAQRQLERLHE